MNSFKNPLVPQIINPIGIDKAIQNIQTAIANVGWVERCFARAYDSHKTIENNPRGNQRVYPEVWQGLGLDLLEVLPNDNLKSQVFFKVDDPSDVKEYSFGGQSLMSNTIHIIFWFNLDKIDASIDYRYTELLKASAYEAIQNADIENSGDVSIIRVHETAANVWRGYDISNIAAELLTHPYGGFRFECELVYQQHCPTIDI